jgi:hypothetical protein
MNQTTAPCAHCNQELVWFDCPYPFPYHPNETPRHGDWVPEHGCAADWSRRSGSDVPIGSTCAGAR